MYRVRVRDQQGQIAVGEIVIHDVRDELEIQSAARRVCRASGCGWPDAGKIRVEREVQRGRWQQIHEQVI